jgi:hypothetical protein
MERDMNDQACVMPHGTTFEGEPRRVSVSVGFLCRQHRAQMDAHVTEIQNLVVDTQRIRDGGAPRDASPKTRHTKSAEAPAPGDLGIMALFDSRTHTQRLAGTDVNPAGDQSEPMIPVEHIAASWLLLVAEERPLTADLPRSLLAQFDLLVRHHDWMAEQLWIDDYLLELAELRKHLRSAVREVDPAPVGRCPSQDGDGVPCGGPLWPTAGMMAVDCGRCHRHFGEAFLRHLGGMIAS